MGHVETEIRSIAHDRVRTALLELTRDGPRVLDRGTIANRAAIDPAVTETVIRELETAGPFEIQRLDTAGEPRWWVA